MCFSIGKLVKKVRAAQSVEANKLSPNFVCAATRGKMHFCPGTWRAGTPAKLDPKNPVMQL